MAGHASSGHAAGRSPSTSAARRAARSSVQRCSVGHGGFRVRMQWSAHDHPFLGITPCWTNSPVGNSGSAGTRDGCRRHRVFPCHNRPNRDEKETRMMRTRVSFYVAALLVVASGSASIPRARAQTPDTLVVAQGVDMQTGDPHKTTLTHAVNVLVNLYDTLISRDVSLALKPGLALSWRAVDPTTWEFKLRQGVKFHNGEPFNAQAVKYSFERMQDPKTKWPGAASIRLIKSVTVVDDSTVRFTTERPWPLLPRYLGYYGMIVPPKLPERGEDALV